MAKKKNTIPSGFEDILGNIYSNAEQGEGITNMNTLLEGDTELPLEEEIKNEPPVNKTEDGEEVDDKTNAHDDDSEIPEDIKNNIDNKTTEVENNITQTEEEHDDEPSDADIVEAQQVGLLFDAIGQSLGWNMADIDEKDRPLTVDALTNYMAEAVRQNSVPEYADDRIQALDEYVKNGGKFEDFYRIQQEGINLDAMDLEDENNQKQIIRELLKHDGYTDDQINKRISRYEDADMLYDESEDALDRLKNIRKAEAEATAKQQEEFARQQQEQSKAFFDAVTNDINNLNSIRGISIPKEDRKALFDYIFKVDQNGVSQYQKDFNENLSKNLIESAYFTMKGDALITGAAKSGESSATEKLRNLLRHSSKNHTSFSAEDKTKSALDLLAGQF